MKKSIVTVLAIFAASAAQAINAQYARQLERSGCTQISELKGCDIHKTKAENAKAGFTNEVAVESATTSSPTPYAGNWVAKNADGKTIASIRIDSKEQVRINGKPVKAKRSDGALVFREGFIIYTIQGDRRLKGEDYWSDVDAKSQGLIIAE